MTKHIDELLLDFHADNFNNCSLETPKNDLRIMKSLARQLQANKFLTQNQANLLVKILTENIENITFDKTLLDNPTWSKPYRVIEQVRNIFIDGETLGIEFNFNKTIKQKVIALEDKIEGTKTIIKGTHYVQLTEHNIYTVITDLKRHKFNIDQQLLDWYDEIAVVINANINPFEFKNLTAEDIAKFGEDVEKFNDPVFVNDRAIRYQYYTDPLETHNTLAEKIADRSEPRVHINMDTVELSDVINAITELDRFPILVVFDKFNVEETIKHVKMLNESITSFDNDQTGIYFRYDNKTVTEQEFNQYIKDNHLNASLEEDTLIAGTLYNNIPKFMITSKWHPKTVISFTNSFKNNKATAYCSDVDLVIFYNSFKPLGAKINEIV